MTTEWTPERISELENWAKKHTIEKNYAKGIADKIDSLESLNGQVRRAYEIDLAYEELEVMWAMQDRMEKSIMMKIKHFFVIVYGEKQNPFTCNLKGKDYLEHYWSFRDFVKGCGYGIKFN